MALYIRNPEVDALAHRIADRQGTSLTQAVLVALQEHDRRCSAMPTKTRTAASGKLTKKEREFQKFKAKIDKIVDSMGPVVDHRTPEEILGYDEYGLPS